MIAAEQAQLQSGFKKGTEHTQLQGTRETRNKDGAPSNSAEGKKIIQVHVRMCDIWKRKIAGVRWLGLLCLILFEMWQEVDTEGRADSGESGNGHFVP